MTKDSKTDEHVTPSRSERLEAANPRRVRYVLLLVAVVAQAAGLMITWPLWNLRGEGVPHLPVFQGGPQFSFGWILIGTLLVIPFRPRVGVWLHLVVMVVACLFDQVRTQPQFLAVWVLMAAAVYDLAAVLARWFLSSLWIWAGVHKWVSPDWFSHRSWNMAFALGLDCESWAGTVAVLVVVSEFGVGLLAWFRPKWGAIGCVLLHVGIVIYLSPLFRDWNYSVIPWNLATAVVGTWILWRAGEQRSKSGAGNEAVSLLKQRLAFVVMLILPAGFYVGWLDHGYAHVLYSDGIPRGAITRNDGTVLEIKAWGELAVPFPNERRLLRQYFDCVAVPGEKLHIRDPRPHLDDVHLKMTKDGIRAISRDDFFSASPSSSPHEVYGVELDSVRSIFHLTRVGARLLKREKGLMIYAIEFRPENFQPELLKHLSGISNVEQIQMAGTPVTDDDLDPLFALPNLSGVGLSNTAVTTAGVRKLLELPKLKHLEADGIEPGAPRPQFEDSQN